MTNDITLIITVLNEARTISNWFESVARQSRLPDRVVICDGGSIDNTPEVINEWAAKMRMPVTVIDAPGANISEGRNLAFRQSESEWIAVTDAGTILDPHWLEELERHTSDADVISGFFYPSGDAAFERFLASMITFRSSEVDASTFLPSSRSLMIRRSAWQSVGGYPEWLDYCEDLVFDLALKKVGCRFAFAPKALVSWSARPNLKSFAKQYYRYGRGDGKAGLWPRRHAIRYATYAAGVLAVIAAFRWPWLFLGIGVGLVAYNWRYFRRVALSRELLGGWRIAWLFAVIPVGTVGDFAKMFGYPAGLLWRRKRDLT